MMIPLLTLRACMAYKKGENLSNGYYIVCECIHVDVSEGGHSVDRDF